MTRGTKQALWALGLLGLAGGAGVAIYYVTRPSVGSKTGGVVQGGAQGGASGGLLSPATQSAAVALPRGGGVQASYVDQQGRPV